MRLLSAYNLLKRLIRKHTNNIKEDKKMTYKITYKTGISFISNAETLVEAKREATEYADYGFGSIYITEGEDSDPVAVKLEHDDEWIEP